MSYGKFLAGQNSYARTTDCSVLMLWSEAAGVISPRTMAGDRMGTDDFPLTQEFVAMMLGGIAADRDPRCGDAAEGRFDHVSPRASDHRESRTTRIGVVRML